MRTEDRHTCPSCGNEYSGAMEFCPVCMLRVGLAGGVESGESSAFENIAKSGLMLLFERPIKVGDVIEVGGNVGEVTRIGLRASIIRTADGSEVIVPNGSLFSRNRRLV